MAPVKESPQEKFPLRWDRNVFVAMRDNVKLAADVFRPDARGKFPGILHFYPYRKDDMISYPNPNTGKGHYFARKGYAEVWVDARGTGGSEGVSAQMYGKQEIQDVYDTIEWIADQPWCDGNVGMTGSSYGGFNTFQQSIQGPKSLKAAIPLYAGVELYNHYYPGGNLGCYLWYAYYGLTMLARNLSPPSLIDEEGRWKKVWDQRIENSYPWLLSWLDNPLPSEFWLESSIAHRLDEIKVPTLFIGGLRDVSATIFLPYFRSNEIKVPIKFIMGPWTHSNLPDNAPEGRFDYEYEMKRWFDNWLKGIDSGVMNDPSVLIYVQRHRDPAPYPTEGRGYWRYEVRWPLERVREKVLFLQPEFRLEEAPPGRKNGLDSFKYIPWIGTATGLPAGMDFGFGAPVDQREDDSLSLTYTSDSLRDEIELVGIPKAILFISSTAQVASFVVKLCDIAPNGTSFLVTRGRLNATRRESMNKPLPMKPGKIYALNILLDAVSYVFEKGHRLRLSVSGSDFPYLWPTPMEAENTIYRNLAHSSRVVLPELPGKGTKTKAPKLRPSLTPIQDFKPRPEGVPTEYSRKCTDYTISTDLVNSRLEVVTKDHSYRYVKKENRAVFRDVESVVSASTKDPSDVTVQASCAFKIMTKMITTKVEARSTLQSSMDTINVTLLADIDLNGRNYAFKSWTKTYPRLLF